MGKSPEELRSDIARTRDNLSGTLDAIEDRVVPGRIVERRKDTVSVAAVQRQGDGDGQCRRSEPQGR